MCSTKHILIKKKLSELIIFYVVSFCQTFGLVASINLMPKKESIVYDITSLKYLTVAMPLLENREKD